MRCEDELLLLQGPQDTGDQFPAWRIGSGCIGLGGAGHLIDWEIFNRPSKGALNGFSHFAVKAEAKGKLLDARVLHGDVPPPYTGSMRPADFSGFGFGPARETLRVCPISDTRNSAAGARLPESSSAIPPSQAVWR